MVVRAEDVCVTGRRRDETNVVKNECEDKMGIVQSFIMMLGSLGGLIYNKDRELVPIENHTLRTISSSTARGEGAIGRHIWTSTE